MYNLIFRWNSLFTLKHSYLFMKSSLRNHSIYFFVIDLNLASILFNYDEICYLLSKNISPSGLPVRIQISVQLYCRYSIFSGACPDHLATKTLKQRTTQSYLHFEAISKIRTIKVQCPCFQLLCEILAPHYLPKLTSLLFTSRLK